MAHTKPLGTECTLYYDAHRDVAVGDVIRTEPAGTCYRVIGVRPVTERSKHYPYRKNLDCVRISADHIEEDDFVHPLYWYPREEGAMIGEHESMARDHDAGGGK